MIERFRLVLIVGVAVLLTNIPVSHAIDDTAPLYMKGHLNPMYMGKVARVLAEIIEIKKADNGRVFYRVDPKLKGIKPFWLTNFSPVLSKMAVGDEFEFIGHVKTAKKVDPSGQLENFLGQPTFLVTRSILSP